MLTSAAYPPITLSRRVFLPCYQHLISSQADIDFLYGGRDSGKSRFVAMMLVYLCLKLPYFRCVLVRKVFNDIRDSQFQTIKEVVEIWGLDHLFTFTVSPLEIRCVNGNKFICRGMDEPGRIKSVNNPSHAWVEEGNQLLQDEFIILMTSLRYNKGRCKTWVSFNPETEGPYTDFWMHKLFYASHDGDIYTNFTSTWSIDVGAKKVEYVYTSTHTTYKDNRYCTPERAAFLEQLRILDPYYYQVFTLGKWGNRKNDDPFCMCFDRVKHIGTTLLDRRYEVYLSFDFNVNPITCGVYQHHSGIRGIESIKLSNSDIYKLCDYIQAKYQGCVFVITGDASGKNTTALVQDGINYYTVIRSQLRLMNTQVHVPTVNPRVRENRVLVNAAFSQVDVKFDAVKCKDLIFDCENVAVDDLGDIDKGDRKNPKKRADHLDHWRYYLNTFHKHLLKI